jgi:hypothetical protein
MRGYKNLSRRNRVEDVGSINLGHGGDQWQARVNMIMTIWCHKKWGISSVDEQIAAS